jgi:hypothetical protein
MSDDAQKLVQAIGLRKDLLGDVCPSRRFNARHKDEWRHRAAEQAASGVEELSPVHLTHCEIAEHQCWGSLSHHSERGDASGRGDGQVAFAPKTLDHDLAGIFVIVYHQHPFRRHVHRPRLYSQRLMRKQTESSRRRRNRVSAIPDREIPDTRLGETPAR